VASGACAVGEPGPRSEGARCVSGGRCRVAEQLGALQRCGHDSEMHPGRDFGVAAFSMSGGTNRGVDSAQKTAASSLNQRVGR